MKKLNIIIATFFLLGLSTKGLYAQSTFTGKPIYNILTKRAGVYLGTTTVELFPNIAPLHVKNFDSLVATQFYDSTAFHRVIPGFMIQGGDPNSRHGPKSTWGMGDTSQPTVNAEFSVAKHIRGTLSAARDTGINSANSQFFICVAAASWLNGQYSVYGRVTAGMNIVDSIVNSPRDSVDNPLQKIEMFVTYVGYNDTVPNAPVLSSPVNGFMGVGTSKSISWVGQSDGIIYHVEVSTDSTFATTYKSVNTANSVYLVTGLQANNTYYWRVRTNNGGYFSNWSGVWHFSTTGVGIEDYAAAATSIIVSPNPSNGVFTFNNLQKENVIEVYDVNGKLIRSLICKDNNCIIDLSGEAKGNYFYKVIAEKREIKRGALIVY